MGEQSREAGGHAQGLVVAPGAARRSERGRRLAGAHLPPRFSILKICGRCGPSRPGCSAGRPLERRVRPRCRPPLAPSAPPPRRPSPPLPAPRERLACISFSISCHSALVISSANISLSTSIDLRLRSGRSAGEGRRRGDERALAGGWGGVPVRAAAALQRHAARHSSARLEQLQRPSRPPLPRSRDARHQLVPVIKVALVGAGRLLGLGGLAGKGWRRAGGGA